MSLNQTKFFILLLIVMISNSIYCMHVNEVYHKLRKKGVAKDQSNDYIVERGEGKFGFRFQETDKLKKESNSNNLNKEEIEKYKHFVEEERIIDKALNNSSKALNQSQNWNEGMNKTRVVNSFLKRITKEDIANDSTFLRAEKSLEDEEKSLEDQIQNLKDKEKVKEKSITRDNERKNKTLSVKSNITRKSAVNTSKEAKIAATILNLTKEIKPNVASKKSLNKTKLTKVARVDLDESREPEFSTKQMLQEPKENIVNANENIQVSVSKVMNKIENKEEKQKNIVGAKQVDDGKKDEIKGNQSADKEKEEDNMTDKDELVIDEGFNSAFPTSANNDEVDSVQQDSEDDDQDKKKEKKEQEALNTHGVSRETKGMKKQMPITQEVEKNKQQKTTQTILLNQDDQSNDKEIKSTKPISNASSTNLKEVEKLEKKNFLKRTNHISLDYAAELKNQTLKKSILDIDSFSEAFDYLEKIQINFDPVQIYNNKDSDFPQTVTVYSSLIVPFLQLIPFAAIMFFGLLLFLKIILKIFTKKPETEKKEPFIIFKQNPSLSVSESNRRPNLSILNQTQPNLNSSHNFHHKFEAKTSVTLKGRKKKTPNAINYNELFSDLEKKPSIVANEKSKKQGKDNKRLDDFLNEAVGVKSNVETSYAELLPPIKAASDQLIIQPQSMTNQANLQVKKQPQLTQNCFKKPGDLLVFDDKSSFDLEDMKDPFFFKSKKSTDELVKATESKEHENVVLKKVPEESPLNSHKRLSVDSELNFNEGESPSVKEKKIKNPEMYKQTDIAKFLKSNEK